MQWVIFVKTFYYDRCKLQWFLKYDFNQMWKGAFLKVIERRKLCTSLWPNLNPFWDQPDPIGPVFRSWGPTRPDSTRILGPKLGSTRKNGSGLAALERSITQKGRMEISWCDYSANSCFDLCNLENHTYVTTLSTFTYWKFMLVLVQLQTVPTRRCISLHLISD